MMMNISGPPRFHDMAYQRHSSGCFGYFGRFGKMLNAKTKTKQAISTIAAIYANVLFNLNFCVESITSPQTSKLKWTGE